jgi:hypothetical protein
MVMFCFSSCGARSGACGGSYWLYVLFFGGRMAMLRLLDLAQLPVTPPGFIYYYFVLYLLMLLFELFILLGMVRLLICFIIYFYYWLLFRYHYLRIYI